MQKAWKSQTSKYARIMKEAHPVINCVYPHIVSHIDSSKQLLDFGCGNGILALSFPNSAKITLYDKSAEFLKSAMLNFEKFNKPATFISDVSQLTSDRFDFISLCFVLMSLKTKSEVIQTLSEIKRVKTKNGRLLIGLTHPCFRQYKYSYFFSEFAELKQFDYSKEGQSFNVTIFNNFTNEKMTFKNYHYSLSFTVNALIELGFTITKIFELNDVNSDCNPNNDKPPYLMLHCK